MTQQEYDQLPKNLRKRVKLMHSLYSDSGPKSVPFHTFLGIVFVDVVVDPLGALALSAIHRSPENTQS